MADEQQNNERRWALLPVTHDEALAIRDKRMKLPDIVPDDAEVVSFGYDSVHRHEFVHLRSSKFAVVPEGHMPPWLTPSAPHPNPAGH